MTNNIQFKRSLSLSFNVTKGKNYLLIIGFGSILMGYFLFKEWSMTGYLAGVTLDDSWIHYRFADNLRHGRGFAFNPGVNTPGSTSPLWVVLLSVLGAGYVVPSKILGVLAYLGSGILAYELAKSVEVKPIYALLAGIGTLAAGRLAWAAPSGMETTTFALLSLIALWLWQREDGRKISPTISLLFGLACLLRPEAYLLLGLSGLAWWISSAPSLETKRKVTVLFQHFTIAGLVIMPYFLFSFITTGHWFPNTFYAKSSTWDCHLTLRYFGWIGLVFFLDNPILAPLALIETFYILITLRWKNDKLLGLSGLWLLLLPVLYGFLAPCISGYYSRYTTPLIPIMMLFGSLGVQKLENKLGVWYRNRKKDTSGHHSTPLVTGLLIEGVLSALVILIVFWVPFYIQSVTDLENMHIRIGEWLAENTNRGDVLALNDIGAIGFIANREVIDLGGLISPDILPIIEGKWPDTWDEPLAEYLKKEQPDYLVIFPNWYPKMIDQLPMHEVYSIVLGQRIIAGIPNLTIVGGGRMVVYKLDWPQTFVK